MFTGISPGPYVTYWEGSQEIVSSGAVQCSCSLKIESEGERSVGGIAMAINTEGCAPLCG